MGEYLKGSLIPALALATGIALSRMTGMVWWFGMIPLLSGIIIYIFLLNVSTDPVRAYRTGKWHAAWILLIFTGTGIIDEALSRPYS
ncbi:MAG: hypothetical protein K2H49_00545, partial [Muribaculaceae bacterium]|nr:hypothetical protein [Muribaculaceae bacterium]